MMWPTTEGVFRIKFVVATIAYVEFVARRRQLFSKTLSRKIVESLKKWLMNFSGIIQEFGEKDEIVILNVIGVGTVKS